MGLFKKIIFIVMTIIVVTCLTSCGKDDDDEPVYDFDKQEIEGTWLIENPSWLIYDPEIPEDFAILNFNRGSLRLYIWSYYSDELDVYTGAKGYYNVYNGACKLYFLDEISSSYKHYKFSTKDLNKIEWTFQVGLYDDHGWEFVSDLGIRKAKKMLDYTTLKSGEKYTIDSNEISFGYDIISCSTHNGSVAKVDKTTGEIEAVAPGITYIYVTTSGGTGVILVEVE